MRLEFKKLNDLATIPQYATKGSSGLDVRSVEEVTVYPNEVKIVKTGLSCSMPQGFELQCRSRSGLASKGIVVANSPGTIDSDYRGEIKVLIHNTTFLPFDIEVGDRIAQLVFVAVPIPEIVEVEELDATDRGDGGFGSTGRN